MTGEGELKPSPDLQASLRQLFAMEPGLPLEHAEELAAAAAEAAELAVEQWLRERAEARGSGLSAGQRWRRLLPAASSGGAASELRIELIGLAPPGHKFYGRRPGPVWLCTSSRDYTLHWTSAKLLARPGWEQIR